MRKAAADRKTTTPEEDVQQYFAALNAKRQFIGATMGMSWRLAISVVIPIAFGAYLDKRFHTAPSWSLTGFFIAVTAASMTVWNTVKELNQMQKEDEENKRVK